MYLLIVLLGIRRSRGSLRGALGVILRIGICGELLVCLGGGLGRLLSSLLLALGLLWCVLLLLGLLGGVVVAPRVHVHGHLEELLDGGLRVLDLELGDLSLEESAKRIRLPLLASQCHELAAILDIGVLGLDLGHLHLHIKVEDRRRAGLLGLLGIRGRLLLTLLALGLASLLDHLVLGLGERLLELGEPTLDVVVRVHLGVQEGLEIGEHLELGIKNDLGHGNGNSRVSHWEGVW